MLVLGVGSYQMITEVEQTGTSTSLCLCWDSLSGPTGVYHTPLYHQCFAGVVMCHHSSPCPVRSMESSS
ncbi:hypothetical protein L873DRAFT_273458 [Choiromyces venosus 120613-1]|uniref:Uncharacterized protein n=1 Tax=Choiromyces venosus 120613-1 TaxID=1336337 RepID=A0A3N4JXF5_9PEZI|nr:hypothetical protein L873DRAFT_273458 [Choiromyces venosus 120613-1]